MQEIRGFKGHLKLTFDPVHVQRANTQYIGMKYRTNLI